MKLIFENWRKHLNEEDYGIDAQPAPFGPEEDLLITMVEAFKESHPELNIGEIGYTDAGQFYVEFDGEKVGMPNSEEYLYRDLVKRTGEGTRNTPRRYGGSMDEKTDIIKETAVPHSAHHVVNKMRTTNPESTAYADDGKPTPAAIAALKSLTHKLSDEEAKRWLERHKDEMDSAEENKEELNEASQRQRDHESQLAKQKEDKAKKSSQAAEVRKILGNDWMVYLRMLEERWQLVVEPQEWHPEHGSGSDQTAVQNWDDDYDDDPYAHLDEPGQ